MREKSRGDKNLTPRKSIVNERRSSPFQQPSARRESTFTSHDSPPDQTFKKRQYRPHPKKFKGQQRQNMRYSAGSSTQFGQP